MTFNSLMKNSTSGKVIHSISQCSSSGNGENTINKNHYAVTVHWLHKHSKPACSRQRHSKGIEVFHSVSASIKYKSDCRHQHGCSRVLLASIFLMLCRCIFKSYVLLGQETSRRTEYAATRAMAKKSPWVM